MHPSIFRQQFLQLSKRRCAKFGISVVVAMVQAVLQNLSHKGGRLAMHALDERQPARQAGLVFGPQRLVIRCCIRIVTNPCLLAEVQ
jgi:hypothetical protein